MRITPLLLAGLVLVGAHAAAAQPAGAQNDEAAETLRQGLRSGDRVTLRLDSGITRGKVLSVGSEELVVSTADGPTRVAFTSIAQARRTRRGVLLGAIIGAGIGGVCGAALGSLYENEGHNGAEPFLVLTAIGLGIGTGIDALINLERTVYRRPQSARLSVVPYGSRGAAGVQVSTSW